MILQYPQHLRYIHLQSLSLDISTFHMIGTNQKQGTLFQSTQIASKDAELEVG